MIQAWPLLIAGIVGTPHCAAMCGPLISAVTRTRRDRVLYQFGRLLGYTSLAILIAQSGSFLDQRYPLIFGSIFGFSMIMMGLYYGGWLRWSFGGIITNLHRHIGGKLGMLGLGAASVALPCGYLYGILIGFNAAASVPEAMIGMTLFWLGTLPGLILVPWGIRKFFTPFSTLFRPIFALSLVGLGLYVMLLRFNATTFFHHTCCQHIDFQAGHTLIH